MKKSEKV